MSSDTPTPSTQSDGEAIPQVATCLCGQISYEVTGKPQFITLCHCINCKKWAGTGFSWNVFFSCDQIHFTKGEALLKTYEDKATSRGSTVQRKFCPECGSPMLATLPHRKDICAVMAGVIEGDVSEIWKPTLEVYCKDRPKWLPADIGLPRYDTSPQQQK